MSTENRGAQGFGEIRRYYYDDEVYYSKNEGAKECNDKIDIFEQCVGGRDIKRDNIPDDCRQILASVIDDCGIRRSFLTLNIRNRNEPLQNIK
ncbi:Lon protease, mitochondrial [Acrasis kona]|uniref:Lon protease, mitochondrial n=1 Tax=Acrasis kona TaxID=1008807 RepID=A0AAW2YN64_9EUKA